MGLVINQIRKRAPRNSRHSYRYVKCPDHPLAKSNGTIRVHRKVLYEKIGPGEHPCHWCGKIVHWTKTHPSQDDAALVADHLDEDKQNNVPENLVPSCGECNWRRKTRVSDNEDYITVGTWRSRAVKRNCRHCGAEFMVPTTYEHKDRGYWCSARCFWDSRAPSDWDGETWIDTRHGLRTRGSKKACEECGKEYVVALTVLRGGTGRGRFCSKRCTGINTQRRLHAAKATV